MCRDGEEQLLRVGQEFASTPEAVLRDVFGYDSFRSRQREVIDQILAGRDVLAVMPTGAGKSICFQVPALMLSGLAIVISPLISLMKDQVGALQQAGVQAAFLNSTLSPAEMGDVLNATRAGIVKLLYVAPERLDMPAFTQLMQEVTPVLVAVDEAHCVSQWGQDFRPSYTRIAGFVDSLPARPVLAAFTATATERVREDIIGLLGLRDVAPVVTSFDRPNLHFEVQRVRDGAARRRAVLQMCRRMQGRSGIVYCMTRKACEEVAGMLREKGISAGCYHAGLTSAQRHRVQDDFVYGRTDVMVATTAFGMGIDKSDVAFVLHYHMPLDIESYYQEAGRAGRDGEPAECLLLYQASDAHLCEFLLERSNETAEAVDEEMRALLLERGLIRLRTMQSYCTTRSCLRAFLLRYFGEMPPLRCGNCGSCETEFEEQDATVEAQKVLSCVFRLRQRGRSVGRSTIVDILRGSRSTKVLTQRYNELSTYGIMRDCPRDRALLIIDELVERGLLTASSDKYHTIAFNQESMRFLREHEKLVIQTPVAMPKVAQAAVGEPVQAGEERRARKAVALTAGDEGLYDELRSLRGRLAEEQGVPAYIVFSNRTLREMASRRPRTREEFLDIGGVGESKCERYSEDFLAAVAAYEETDRD